jgi:hypothetical protein
MKFSAQIASSLISATNHFDVDIVLDMDIFVRLFA